MKQGVCYVPHYTEHSSIPTDIDWNLNLCINIFVGPLHAEWLRKGSHKHWNPEIRRVTPSPGLTIVPPCKGCNVQNKEMVAGIKIPFDMKWTTGGPHRCEMVSLPDIAFTLLCIYPPQCLSICDHIRLQQVVESVFNIDNAVGQLNHFVLPVYPHNPPRWTLRRQKGASEATFPGITTSCGPGLVNCDHKDHSAQSSNSLTEVKVLYSSLDSCPGAFI